MSTLWTPYITDENDVEILDLSKSATSTTTTSVKTEPLSPAPSPPLPPTPPPASAPIPYGYYIPATLEPTLPPMEYYAAQVAFQYGHPPQPQISPSSSSGYADEAHHHQQPSVSPNSGPDGFNFNYDSEYLNNNPEYIIFERDALRAMAEKNGGTLMGNNPRMRRSVRSTKEEVDDGYRQQRERNNAAAKQSRDRRKLREVKLALKVSFLEKQTRRLQAILASGMCSKCFPHHELY